MALFVAVDMEVAVGSTSAATCGVMKCCMCPMTRAVQHGGSEI